MTVLSPREAYGLLADEYDQQPNALLSLERRVMSPLLPSLQGKRVVDAGSGTARWAIHCAAGGARVVAIDFSKEMLQRGPRPAIQGDLRSLPIRSGAADITLCSFAVGYAPGCFAELARITRRGGILLVSDMHPDAVQRGWTRSFRHSSGTIHIAHEPYHLEDLRAEGMDLLYLLEPKFGPVEHEIFLAAGRSDRFAEAARGPALFIGCWTRR